MLLKEVTLEDLRQAARTGGLPATPERIQAARGHSGIPAALAGIEPFRRFSDGQTSGTAGQPMAERIMAAQRGGLNEFGQSLEEGRDQPSVLNLPQSMQNAIDHDEGELPDESMPDPMTVQPPEVTSSIDAGFFPKTLQGEQAGDPEKRRGFERDYDFNMRREGPVRNREIKRNRSQQEILSGRQYGSDDSHLGEEYGPIVQNPRNYGYSHRYDPFSLKNRIQTQEPVEDTEFAEDSRPLEGTITAPFQGPMSRLGQELSMTEPDPDAGERQSEAQANRARSLDARSAQQSTATPMDAAMQALGDRKTEEAARVPEPVQPRPLNTRRGGRGQGPNSRRNRNRR